MGKFGILGVSWHVCLRHFQSRYDYEIWHTDYSEAKWGSQNFFGVRIFSGGFKMGLQRKLVACLFWATGKTHKAQILQGASLYQYRTSEFYSAWLVNRLSLNFHFSRKSQDYTISLILLTIFFRFQENFKKRLNFK